LESNSDVAEQMAADAWGFRRALFDTPPLRLTIHVRDGAAPSATPAYRSSAAGFSLVCDSVTHASYSIHDHAACLHVSAAALDQPEWFRHELLECLVLTALDTAYFVGLHAACVVPPGGKPGLLLCGVSGSGKTTLAYACARAGWTFVSDDSHLAKGAGRIVTGSSQTLRLREPARALFPELCSRPSVIAPNGKPCIEFDAAESLPVSDSAPVRHCVFLSRRPGPAALRACREDDAVTYFMQYNTRYDPSEAVRRIRQLVRRRAWLLEYEHPQDAIEMLGRLP
jgi:hypothetical protein